jgi:hypothetical protein
MPQRDARAARTFSIFNFQFRITPHLFLLARLRIFGACSIDSS